MAVLGNKLPAVLSCGSVKAEFAQSSFQTHVDFLFCIWRTLAELLVMLKYLSCGFIITSNKWFDCCVCSTLTSCLTFCHLVQIPPESCFHQCPPRRLPVGMLANWHHTGIQDLWDGSSQTERAIPQHPSLKKHQLLCCFFLAVTNNFPQRRGHACNTFTNTSQAWNCTCFE